MPRDAISGNFQLLPNPMVRHVSPLDVANQMMARGSHSTVLHTILSPHPIAILGSHLLGAIAKHFKFLSSLVANHVGPHAIAI